MSATDLRIPVFEASGGRRTPRKERRELLVRHVEYRRFPRVSADQRLRLGTTRDVSASGLCLRAEGPEPLGALLRITLRAIDGAPEREAIARVAWTGPADEGAHWLGLAQVEASPARPLRPPGRRRRVA